MNAIHFLAPPLQERQVNRAPHGLGHAGGMTDLALGWGGASPQTWRLRPCPTPNPSPEGEGLSKVTPPA